MAKKKKIDLEKCISVPQAAKLAGVSDKWMRQLVIDGKVDGIKIGRNYVVDKLSAKAFDRHPTSGRPRQ